MKYTLHATTAYHVTGIKTLGWELTVCNALDPPDSPCRKILRNRDSYGHLLYDFLKRLLPSLPKKRRIIEIGGGYGALMRDFLERQEFDRVVMVDISPVLIERQRETLYGKRVEFRCEDFLETPASCLDGMDMALMNENLGDFPTLTDLGPELFDAPPDSLAGPLYEARDLIDRYGLSPPPMSPFHLNIGALKALEKLCLAGIPVIFLSEHSCEAKAPPPFRDRIGLKASGNPERIRLYGHDEYTIRFSDLETMGRALGYATTRGPLADILEWEMTGRLGRILTQGLSFSDEDEILRQFLGDLYQYEYLVLVKDPR